MAHAYIDSATASVVCLIGSQYTAQQLFVVTGIYGIYIQLFAIALWASWQESTKASKAMRAACITMFLVVTIQMVLTICAGPFIYYAECGLYGTVVMDGFTYLKLNFLGASTFITGVLSDAMLAWRCYVLYGSQKRNRWFIALAFTLLVGLGLHMAATGASYMWSPLYLVVNTVLTVSTAVKIIILHRQASFRNSRSMLIAAGRAFIESALITWIAVLLVVLCDFLPDSPAFGTSDTWSHIYLSVQPALTASLPQFFGISQTLIISRVAFSRFSHSPKFATTLHVLTTDFDESSPNHTYDFALQGSEAACD